MVHPGFWSVANEVRMAKREKRDRWDKERSDTRVWDAPDSSRYFFEWNLYVSFLVPSSHALQSSNKLHLIQEHDHELGLVDIAARTMLYPFLMPQIELDEASF